MALIKWSPFFFDPFEDVDKTLERMGAMVPSTQGTGMIPPIDMYETKDAIVVETTLAGVDPNKIDIAIENGVLIIKGTNERKTEVDEKNYYRREIRSGAIFRQVALPSHVKEDKVEASYDSGVLKIIMPKIESKGSSVKVTIKKK